MSPYFGASECFMIKTFSRYLHLKFGRKVQALFEASSEVDDSSYVFHFFPSHWEATQYAWYIFLLEKKSGKIIMLKW